MKAKILSFVFLIIATISYAQEEPCIINTDRPGHTWGTNVMQLHKINWENGIGFESMKGGAHTMTLDNTIVRYGIFQNMELRVSTDFLLFNDGQAKEPTFGISPLTIGTKLKVFEGRGVLPSVGLLAEFSTPIGSKELLPSHLAPSLYLLFEHEVNNWFGICYNAGVEWDGETATPTTFLALGFSFNITDNLGTYIETFNYLHPVEENRYMTELGLTWLVSPKVQLDIEGDLDFKNPGKYYAVSAGIAWLIN